MFTVISSILKNNAKVVVLITALALLSYCNNNLNKEVHRLKALELNLRHDYKKQEQEYLEQIKVAENQLQSLMSSIEKYKQNLVAMSNDIAIKTKELEEIRIKEQELIDVELSKDSSDSNKLILLKKILNEFAN